ncbi:MAG: TonB family protein [Thermoanaerobaculia bacterium]
MSAPIRPPSPGRGFPPGFWQRPDVKRLLPVAIGVVSTVLLVLTLVFAPRRSRKFVPPPGEAAAPEAAVVCEAEAIERADADPRAAQIAVLARGTPVTILGRRGLWFQVKVGSNAGGFVLSRSIEREVDRAARARRAETIFKFEPLSGDVAEATPFLLAPFSFSSVWGGAEQGASLDIYSVDHAFYAVKLPDGTLGFVASRDVDIVPANPSEPALVPGSGRVVKGISVSEENPAGVEPEPVPVVGEPAPVAPATESIPPAGVAPEVSIAPAVLIERIDPIYPSGALAARASGTVILQISIDAQGIVTKVEVKRQGLLGMTEAAVQAVSRWKYRPATGPRGPIASMKQVRIEFQPPG